MPIGSACSLIAKRRETPWYNSAWSFANVVCYFLKPHLLYHHFSWTKSVLIPLIFFNQSLLEYSGLYDVILVYCMTKWINDTYPYILTFHLNLNVILIEKSWCLILKLQLQKLLGNMLTKTRRNNWILRQLGPKFEVCVARIIGNFCGSKWMWYSYFREHQGNPLIHHMGSEAQLLL